MQYRETFESGTVGAALGGGCIFDSVVATGTGGTIVYDSVRAMGGSRSIKVSPVGASGAVYAAKNFTAGIQLAARFYVYTATAFDNGASLFGFYVGATRVADIRFNSSQKIRVTAAASASDHAWTAANNFPLNQWIRVEVYLKVGTTISNGQIQVAYYAGDSTTAIENSSLLTAVNTGTEGITSLRFGLASTSTQATAYWLDSFSLNTDATGLLGPDTGAAPAVNAGASQIVAPGATVTLNGTGTTDSDSSFTVVWDFAWPVAGAPPITNATATTATFTAGSDKSVYVARLTATDPEGHSSQATTNILVTTQSGSSVTTSKDMVWTGSNWE